MATIRGGLVSEPGLDLFRILKPSIELVSLREGQELAPPRAPGDGELIEVRGLQQWIRSKLSRLDAVHPLA